MFQRFTGRVPWTSVAFLLGLGHVAFADGIPPFPRQVPPLVGTAVVSDSGKQGELAEWAIHLTVPKTRWEVVGSMVPKREWPRLRAEVEQVRLILRMGGPSQLAESRIVDVKGRPLSRQQIRERLSKEAPVLVSVSGDMPDPYYLQLAQAQALVVILGPRDGSPAPELLPATVNASPESRAKEE